MKKTALLLCLIIFSFLQCYSCANYYYTLDKEGNLLPLGYNWRYPFNKNFNLELNVQKIKKLQKKLEKEKNYMLLSDYSVCLMKLGRNKEALKILVELYSHYPNEYKIAANLGTAYELNGEVDSALKYIKRDMELNPNDHEGSEWVHVKILQTKLELKKDPGYLNNHTVLQLNEKQKNDSIILQHINIQLQERVPFTPGPDAIMASLMTDLGDISAAIRSIEYARAYYQIAKEYYGSKSPALDGKIKEIQKLMNKYSSIHPPRYESSFEGEKTKVGYFKYQELLNDNDYQHYKVNWEKINTDVNALLALVDFTKSVQEIKSSAKNLSSKQPDELKLIPEHLDNTVKVDSLKSPDKANTKPTEIKSENTSKEHSTWIYILYSVILILAASYFFIKRSKKN